MIAGMLLYPGAAFMVFMGLLYSGILRKFVARMQNRVGPSWFQPFYDVIKLLSKEDLDPEQAKPGFTLWPMAALTSVMVAGLFVPIAGTAVLSGAGDMLILIYFLAFSSVALCMSGIASSNPFSVIGSVRGLIQMIGYEFPLIAAVLVPVLYTGELSPSLINSFQVVYGPLALTFPFAAAAFMVALLAESEVPPFHIPMSHQEVVSGYATEYSGPRLAMIELTHFVKLFVLISLFVALFIGGSFDILTFLTRSLGILFLVTLSSAVMARMRITGSLKLCWFFGLVALIDVARILLV